MHLENFNLEKEQYQMHAYDRTLVRYSYEYIYTLLRKHELTYTL